MERFTTETGEFICSGEHVCRADDECFCDSIEKALKKLSKYETLEEQGLLLRIPVRVGESAYVVSQEWDRVFPITVAAIVVLKNCLYVRNGRGETFCFGTEAFATFSEAEAALAEMEK